MDLWRYETKDGRGIRKALDWLIPFATGEKKWDYEQLGKLQGPSLAPFLRRAAVALGYAQGGPNTRLDRYGDAGLLLRMTGQLV